MVIKNEEQCKVYKQMHTQIKKENGISTLHQSVISQSFIISVFFLRSPRLRDRKKLKVSEDEEEEEGEITPLSTSQSGAGVYRGNLRWWEGGERVQVVQQVSVQRCPTWVPVEVVWGGAGGQQLPVQHHGVER